MVSVLIVDDSPTMRGIVAWALEPLRASFEEAGNGLEAIEKLELKAFDLAVLDLNMPDVGGVDVIRFVRSRPGLRRLPILVLTSRADERTRREVLEAGADDYHVKPFEPAVLLRAARDLLEDGGGR